MEIHDEIGADEAAKILGVSTRHVRWYFDKGLLPGRRIGQRVLIFPRAAVEALKDNKPKKTGRPPVKKSKAKAAKAKK